VVADHFFLHLLLDGCSARFPQASHFHMSSLSLLLSLALSFSVPVPRNTANPTPQPNATGRPIFAHAFPTRATTSTFLVTRRPRERGKEGTWTNGRTGLLPVTIALVRWNGRSFSWIRLLRIPTLAHSGSLSPADPRRL
jgi:hypothetical protein